MVKARAQSPNSSALPNELRLRAKIPRFKYEQWFVKAWFGIELGGGVSNPLPSCSSPAFHSLELVKRAFMTTQHNQFSAAERLNDRW